VLRGEKTDKISQWNHHELKTFGVGADLAARTWNGVFRQLVAMGALGVDAERFNALFVTPEGRRLLKGETPVVMTREEAPASGSGSGARRGAGAKGGRARVPSAELTERDPVFAAVRALRLVLAKAQGVPPYVIFHDSTLAEMASRRPRTLTEFADLPGVGATKLDRYGQSFLDIIVRTLAQ